MSEKNNEKIDHLIEYFYIIGPNSETIKEDEFYNNFSPSKYINAKILSKFPPVENPQCSIKDEIIISHCFPNGYKIIESKDEPQAKIFHFSFQNIFLLHSGKKNNIYFTCLKFYESVSKYYEIKQRQSYNFVSEKNREDFAKQAAQKFKRQSAIIKDNPILLLQKKQLLEKFYIPKVICFCSFVPFPYEFGVLLNKIINYTINYNNSGIIKNGSENKESKNKGNEKTEKKENKDKNSNIKKIIESKIKEINEKEKEKKDNIVIIPLEKIIEKIITEIPMPPRGVFYINFKKDNILFKNENDEFKIQQKEFTDYYFPSYLIQNIFTFKTQDIIEIYKSLLLEIPILFFSVDIEKLTNIFGSFISLLYPFNCQCPNVSVLPDINSSAIQNFDTFVFGINQKWITEKTKNYFDRYNLKVKNKAILICDIDNSKIEIFYDKLEKDEHIVDFKDLGKNNDNNNSNNNNFNISYKNINHENK